MGDQAAKGAVLLVGHGVREECQSLLSGASVILGTEPAEGCWGR